MTAVDATTVAVLLTPPGRGAVATIRVAGPQALACVEPRFRAAAGKPLATFALGRIVFGTWTIDKAGTCEEVVVSRLADDAIELHCHGGIEASRALMTQLAQAGCTPIDPDQWLLSQHACPVVQAAWRKLPHAITLRTAALLLDQTQGAWHAWLERAARAVDLRSRAELAELADGLLRHAPWSLRLPEPFRVTLAGVPNVGKSSLLNALAGYARALVHDLPGTTRDVVRTCIALDGWPIDLADTAGLRSSDDPIEQAGVERAGQQAASADLVLWLVDASRPETWLDPPFDERRVLRVANKLDLTGGRSPAGMELGVSAATGSGLERLANRIVARLVPHPPSPGAAVALIESQVGLARSLAALAEASNWTQAAAELDRWLQAGSAAP